MKGEKTETYNYKNRLFSIRAKEETNGFSVICTDETLKKQVPLKGTCSYENYFEIIKRGGNNPVEDVVDAIKETLRLWIDKNII